MDDAQVPTESATDLDIKQLITLCANPEPQALQKLRIYRDLEDLKHIFEQTIDYLFSVDDCQPDAENEVRCSCLLLRIVLELYKETAREPQLPQLSPDLVVALHTLLFEPEANAVGRNRSLVGELPRLAVYELLQEICSTVGLADLALKQMFLVVDNACLPKDRHMFRRHQLTRPPNHPLGLMNAAQTCYLNAVVQQLFGNISFRKMIRSIAISDIERQQVLVALQEVFMIMEHSLQSSIMPTELHLALGVDIDSQEDGGLFFTDLLEKLEACILAEPDRNKFKQFFRGREISQTLGDCRHVSERSDTFVSLSLPVKDKYSLHQSLTDYVSGYALGDTETFACGQCRDDGQTSPVKASRRTRLEDLPDDLVFHLMKFEYDPDTGPKKINEPFDFPETLNMREYMVDPSLNKTQEDLYELVGVVVHQGLVVYGHYWSYVRHENCDQPRWFRMEDHKSWEVSLDEVLCDTRGGHADERTDNAYLLFYRRVRQPRPGSEESSAVVLESTKDPALHESIARSNDSVLRACRLFDYGMINYVCNFLDLQQQYTSLDFGISCIRLALKYLFRCLCRNRDGVGIPEICGRIMHSIQDNSKLALVALSLMKNRDNFRMVFTVARPEARQAMALMLLECLQCIRHHYPADYGTAVRPSDVYRTRANTHLDTVVSLLENLQSTVDFVRTSALWGTYFTFLRELTNLGPYERYVLAKSQVATLTFDCVVTPENWINERFPDLEPDDLRETQVENFLRRWATVLELLSLLLDSPMVFDDVADSAEAVSDGVLVLYMSRDQKRCILEREQDDILYFVESVCTNCAFDDNMYYEQWLPCRLINTLVTQNTSEHLSNLVFVSIRNLLRGSSRTQDYLRYGKVALMLCTNPRLSVNLRTMLFDTVLRLTMTSFFTARLTLGSLPVAAMSLPVSTPFESDWIVDLLLSYNKQIRLDVVETLGDSFIAEPEHVVGRPGSLLDHMQSSGTIIGLLDRLTPPLKHLVSKGDKRARSALRFFAVALEHLFRRHSKMDPRTMSQTDVERALRAKGFTTQTDIDREANICYKLCYLDSTVLRNLEAEAFQMEIVQADLDEMSTDDDDDDDYEYESEHEMEQDGETGEPATRPGSRQSQVIEISSSSSPAQ